MANTGLLKRSKSKLNKNFSIVSNKIIQNKNISFEARGLLVFLLSLPDDWVLHKTWIMKEYGIGKHKLTKMFKELEDNGYFASFDMIVEKGRFKGKNYIVYEEPQNNVKECLPFDEKPSADFPMTDFPSTVFPPTENPPTTKNTYLESTHGKKEKTITNRENVFFKDYMQARNHVYNGNTITEYNTTEEIFFSLRADVNLNINNGTITLRK